MKYAVLLAMASFFLGTAEAQTWVQLTGSAFVVTRDQLHLIQGTLESRVSAAARARGLKLPEWRQFLVQYRAEHIKGLRVIEVQGSCHREPGIDIRKEFVGDQVDDGGTCYFMVLYVVESHHYSNVVFHGYA